MYLVKPIQIMPIYEYKCSNCSAVTEEIRKIADRNSPTYCKSCDAQASLMLSSFNVPSGSVSFGSNKGLRDQSTSSSDIPTGPCGIRINSPSKGIKIRGCTFEGLNVGISAHKDAEIEMTGNRFIKVDKPIEFHGK